MQQAEQDQRLRAFDESKRQFDVQSGQAEERLTLDERNMIVDSNFRQLFQGPLLQSQVGLNQSRQQMEQLMNLIYRNNPEVAELLGNGVVDPKEEASRNFFLNTPIQ